MKPQSGWHWVPPPGLAEGCPVGPYSGRPRWGRPVRSLGPGHSCPPCCRGRLTLGLEMCGWPRPGLFLGRGLWGTWHLRVQVLTSKLQMHLKAWAAGEARAQLLATRAGQSVLTFWPPWSPTWEGPEAASSVHPKATPGSPGKPLPRSLVEGKQGWSSWLESCLWRAWPLGPAGQNRGDPQSPAGRLRGDLRHAQKPEWKGQSQGGALARDGDADGRVGLDHLGREQLGLGLRSGRGWAGPGPCAPGGLERLLYCWCQCQRSWRGEEWASPVPD